MRIGLISDTHMPQRWPALPDVLASVFADVTLILHAGDVGELWVLDQLSSIAPVIAVHGNDDSVDAQHELPEQQILFFAPHRIHLWHGHYRDRQDELASRVGDNLLPKLEHIAHRAHSSGATLSIFGHWHIPFVYPLHGVTLINPGAIASGNEMTRQLIQTVAILDLDRSGSVAVTHYDLSCPQVPFDPAFMPIVGFERAAERYCVSILAPAFQDAYIRLRSQLTDRERATLLPMILQLSHEVWGGTRDAIDADAIETVLTNNPLIPDVLCRRIKQILNSPT